MIGSVKESNNHSAVFWGILCGVSMIAWVLIEFFLGFHSTLIEIGQYSGYFSIVIPVTFIFIALYEYQSFTRHTLLYLDGINRGFMVAVISALTLAIFFIFYNAYINPEWIELTVEWQRKKLILSGASNDVIALFAEQNRHHNSNLGQFISGIIGWTALGVMVTLIDIPIVRKFGENR